MNENQIASEINDIINVFSDYIKTGFKEKHPDIEFNLEKSIKTETAFHVQENEIRIHKKNEFVDIREKRKKIISLSEEVAQCTNCGLCKVSGKISGAGNVNADVFMIIEPPSADDESSGRPLSGEAGIFVKKWFGSIDIDINDVFMTNIIKCNPKKGKITREIIEQCRTHLDRQIEIIEPKVILSLGQLTASSLKRMHFDLDKNHGIIYEYNGYPVISTFSPYAVLKDTQLKKLVWNDLNVLKEFLKEQ